MNETCSINSNGKQPSSAQDDNTIMKKIRTILGRGNNAEIKQKKDGSLTVLEVKKNIV